MKLKQTIWKYTLPVTSEASVELPQFAQVLSVDMDPSGERIALWAAVWPDEPATPRTFYVRGTGEPLEPAMPADHLATVIDRTRGLVWHVFEGRPA